MLQPWLSADELEEVARQRLAPAAYDYIAGGSGAELTLAANREAFLRFRLRPRVLTGVAAPVTATTVLGMPLDAPLFVSPMGGPAHALAHRDGVPGAAAAAADAGIAYMVSASSVPSLDLPGPAKVAQVYPLDRGATAELVAQAAELGYRAVCLTADVPVAALRRRNLRHGTGVPSAPDSAIVGGFANPAHYARATGWEEVDWLKSQTPLPLVLKGVMTAEDARLAVEHGLAAVVVSNHGGRQLDHAFGTVDVLREVVEAADGKLEVLIDGGVRTATDVAVAICLGARAVGLGKAVMWALAAGGRPAVANFLRATVEDLARTMALMGVASTAELKPAHVGRL